MACTRSRAPAFAALAFLSSCASTSLPGTLLGTYKVDATPQSNTCGSGLGAPDPWTFDVQISKDGSTLYWSWLDGTSPMSSTFDGSSSTTLSRSGTANVDATADGGTGPCTMERDDTITLTLGAGNPPSTFAGTIDYAFKATSGSDCSDQLSASGGKYDTIPCTLVMTMTASKQ